MLSGTGDRTVSEARFAVLPQGPYGHRRGGPPHVIFYVLDAEFGPGFIKICTYFPYPGKVWLNGHEWAKRQARRVGLAFTELSNGFASCE